MVEFEENPMEQTCVCRCPSKMLSPLTIRKDRSGYIFFEVVVEKGSVPRELSGKYSSMLKAKEAVSHYFRNMDETAAVRRENFAKEREERKASQNAAKPLPEGN